MTELFIKILNMSLAAGWLVAAVLVLRLVLRKAPRWLHVLLWGLVGVRLCCPAAPKSLLSLIPSSQVVSPQIMLDPTPTVQTGIFSLNSAINSAINPVITQTFAPELGASANPLQIWLPILARLWLLGMLVLAGYTAVSYWRLRRRVSSAVLLRENIYQSEGVGSPFVLGIIRPRIYLPFSLSGQDMTHVIAHEKAHIRRGDHWWKPLGFGLLTLHWFNPLMWLAYTRLCRDIELACDEKVIRELGTEQRADYSQALLSCSVGRKMIAACPLAFGEVGVKARVKSVLSYKKPAFWLVLAALILCAVAAVCFLTDPVDAGDFGLQSLRVFGSSGEKFTVTVNYTDSRTYSVRMMAETEKEQSGDYLVDYDGALGKYRAQITFYDTEPGAAFLETFAPWQVYTLSDVPRDFGGELKLKCAYTPEHSYILYLGSDVPFRIEERDHARLNGIRGNIHFQIEKQVQTAADRLAPGVYIPAECVYMSPLSSYCAANLPNDYRYTVTQTGFVTEYLPAAESYERAVDWKWQSVGEAAKALSFAKGTWFEPVLEKASLYQKLSATEHILLLRDGTLYLIRSGDARMEYTAIWSVYKLVPEAAYETAVTGTVG